MDFYSETPRSISIPIQEEPSTDEVPKLLSAPEPAVVPVVAPTPKPSVHFNSMKEKDYRLAFMGLALALVVVAGGVSYMNKKILDELRQKDVQVNSLIAEVGELREENIRLYSHLSHSDESIDLIEETVVALEDVVTAVNGGGGLFGLQAKLDELNSELSSKEAAIETLLSASGGFSETSIERDETFDVLVLGTHGKLTDTIMVASVNPSKETVSLFSIPRDLAVNGRRINEYYYKYGADSMKEQIETITGLYPERYVLFDLAAFEEVIDVLGGIDVTVETAIYDTMYPGPNYTYSTFSLEVGEHHLDGVTALQYARSRKSTTDFDRAARQQQIIEAVRNKFEELNLIGDADKLIQIYNEVIDGVDTDVDVISAISYLTQYRNYEIEKGNVLSSSNYLYSTTGTGGAYLLIPRDGTYQEIKDYVADVVKN